MTDLINRTAADQAPALLLPGISVQSKAVSVGAGETYAPDLRQGMEHNITITGATATIANPVLGGLNIPGWTNLLVTHVRNASGGATTITWGSKFVQAAFTDPTNGNGVITLWHYDVTQDKWYASARQTLAN
jgi:hypothetical protein